MQDEGEETEVDDEDDAGEDAWGDDAVLCWDGAEPAQSSSGEWGSGACMEWNGDRDRVDVGDKDEGDKDDDDEDEDDDGGMGEWHDIDAVDDTNDNDTHEQGTGDCPDYASWTVLKLQRLVTAYGYRSTKDHAALVRLATACWEAQAGVKATKALAGGSADETKQKKKSKKPPAAEPGTEKSLDQQFYSMIHDDPEFYIRVLRYEPIAFDELVSRALRAGIKGRGWKDELKRFMDARGVSYYTSDPTAPRRRH